MNKVNQLNLILNNAINNKDIRDSIINSPEEFLSSLGYNPTNIPITINIKNNSMFGGYRP